MTRWFLGRTIRVLTSTGRWEPMRVIETSPLHLAVRDQAGRVYLTARPRM